MVDSIICLICYLPALDSTSRHMDRCQEEGVSVEPDFMACGIWHVSIEPLYVFFSFLPEKILEFASTWDGQQYICLSGTICSRPLHVLKRCDPVQTSDSLTSLSSELGQILLIISRIQYFGCLYGHMYLGVGDKYSMACHISKALRSMLRYPSKMKDNYMSQISVMRTL